MRTSFGPYIQMARVDHWTKNVFVIPGFLVALSISPGFWRRLDPVACALGLLAICIVTSSNYVLNEILDAQSDRFHPYKSARSAASGQVRTGFAYAEWLILLAVGLALGWLVSAPFTLTLIGLWLAGCLYNVPPIRTKDVPYLDVLVEGLMNPLRLLAGWYLTKTAAIPITFLLLSYWMAGCYFMAIKRFAECRELPAEDLRRYRKAFDFYSEKNLLTSIVFYGSQAMLFFGAFIVRYRLELILSFPLVALVMALYFRLAFRGDSPVQHPEGLFREPAVVLPVLACAIVITVLLFVDVPPLHRIFRPTTGGF
jgi:4-hydroxybenzoate polyprenyltransferase